jgi:vanillate O-demethylase ferredoxin subunit
MKGRHEWRSAVVGASEEIASGVRMLDFKVEDDLAAFEPGSHTNIRVMIGDTPALRSYTCIPAPPGHIRLAVRLHDRSRGGSRFMWSLKPGERVEVTVPENRFELSWRASSYLLVAGGIGITPIYGMAKALARHGAPLRLLYGGRSRAEMGFADELEALLGERAELFPDDEGGRMDLAAAIDALPADGELYICGPLPMLDWARGLWAESSRPASRFRCEVFGDSGTRPEVPFSVTVANRDVTVQVPPDQSLLDALTAAGVDMIWDCRRGECGLCAVDILELDGEIDHRDVFFSDEEKAEGKRMCACVSRLTGGHALIDTGWRGA